MAENEVVFDFDFEGVGELDEPTFQVITDFGQFRLAARRKVTLYQAGQSITIPEIEINGQPYTRKGIKEGGKTWMYFFTRTAEKQDGSEFTEVRMFTTQTYGVDAKTVANMPVYLLSDNQQKQFEQSKNGEKTADGKSILVWLSDWTNLQVPAIQALSKEHAQLVGSGKPFYASAKNWNVGKRPNVVNEGAEEEKKYYDRYWFDFTIYPNKESMVAAREAYFASLNGNGDSSGLAYPVTPVDWTDNEETMAQWVKDEVAAGKALSDVAAKAGLVEGAVDKNGNPVAYKAILAAILDIPEPTLKL